LLLQALTEHQNFEKEEFLSQIQNLQKELSCLSSCFLAKEKDNLRKDLEKTKVKLKETESKLKNAVQEKTKLEVLFYMHNFLPCQLNHMI
jgi:centromeric protein E